MNSNRNRNTGNSKVKLQLVELTWPVVCCALGFSDVLGQKKMARCPVLGENRVSGFSGVCLLVCFCCS